MLVFSRRVGERILIGDDIEITVVKIRGHEVQLGFTAPPEVAIHRAEIHARVSAESARSAASTATPKAESA
jgi:carbon storage regulator